MRTSDTKYLRLFTPIKAFWIALLPFFASCSEILSPDITDNDIVIHSPNDSLYTNGHAVNFWWEQDAAIERYEFRLTYFTNGNLNLLLDTAFINNTFAHDFSTDNVYQWQVRGKNEGSATPWFQRSIYIDRTAPDKATATNMDGDTLQAGATDSIQWLSTDYPLNNVTYPVSDSLYLYRKNDSTTIGAKLYFGSTARRSLAITANSPSPLNGPGKYYWRVITIDKAGNRQPGNFFHFVVQ